MANRHIPDGKPIRAVVSDVDGVLTDGTVTLAPAPGINPAPGSQPQDFLKARAFHVHDGMGVQLLLAAGVRVGWMSSSQDDGVIRARANGLRVSAVDVGDGDKGERLERLCRAMGVELGETAYIGDDVNDLPAFERAGFTACPYDARPEIRSAANLVLTTPGGRGAFRELADLVLAHVDRLGGAGGAGGAGGGTADPMTTGRV